MGLFSAIGSVIGGLVGGPFGAVFGQLGGGLFDEDRQQDALDDRTAAANAASIEQQRLANKANRKAATVAYKRDRKTMKVADRMNDANAAVEREFLRKEAAKSRAATERAALRNRRWAKQDYRQTKADQATQLLRLRRSADRAGFNPLSVLGTPMVPGAAGGLTSSSYAAASGVGVTPVSGFGASTPMSYGAPIAVAPLASNEAVEGAVTELGRELTGEAAIERANAQLAQDIAKVELERMKAGLGAPIVPNAPMVASLGGATFETSPGVARMGSPPVQVGSERSMGPWLTTDMPQPHKPADAGVDDANPRSEELVPVKNDSGMTKLDSNWVREITGGVPAYIPTVNDEPVGGEFFGPIWGIGGAAFNNRVLRPMGMEGSDVWKWLNAPPEPMRQPATGLTYTPSMSPSPEMDYGGRLPRVNLPKVGVWPPVRG